MLIEVPAVSEGAGICVTLTPNFEFNSNEEVLPEADGVAEPVGVETPLGPDTTDAAPLATSGAKMPAGILDEPDHFS